MRLSTSPTVRLPRLVLVLVPVLLLVAAPVADAHDEVTGTPDVTIHIDAAGVSDQSVVVRPGAIVAFVNRDGDRHRMRSRTRPGEFDTGDIEAGDRALVRFVSTGTVRYADERTEAARFAGEIVVRDASAGATGGGGSAGAAGTDRGAATPPRSGTIRIADRAFTPATVSVAVGGTVTWRNEDDREHTATSSGKGGISSPVLQPGSAYRRSFATPGTFAFLCAIHPEMRGTVRVVAATGAASGTAPDKPKAEPSKAPAGLQAAAQPAGGSASHEARIVDFSFTPTPVAIVAGDRVTWTNRGQAPHTVTATEGSFDSGTLTPGQSFTQVFTKPGRYAYICAFHPQMSGRVEVAATSGDAAAPARVAPDAPSSPDPGLPEAQAVEPSAQSSPPVPDAAQATGFGPSLVASPVEPAAQAVVSTDDPVEVGRLAMIGAVVLVNVGAALLFMRTIGGAARRRG